MAEYYLIYDDLCEFCRGAVGRLMKLDKLRQVQVVPLSKPELPAGLPIPPRERRLEEIHLVGRDGSVWRGADAVAKVVSLFPKSRWLGWMMRWPLVRQVARGVYGWVARHRDRGR